MTTLKDLRPLSPAPFFNLSAEVPHAEKKKNFKRGRLPDITGLTGEGHLVDVSLLWSPLALYFEVKGRLSLDSGDQIELFIDTRDLKNSHVVTRFCHHFIIDLEEELGSEITRFRGDDTHLLADSSLISVSTEGKRSSFTSTISFPKEILFGYDPKEFDRMGLSYRFVRNNGEKQHFPLSSTFFNLEKHPALWASLHLCK